MDRKTICALRKISCIWFLFVPLMVMAQHSFEIGVRGGVAAWSSQTHYVSALPHMHAGLEIAYSDHSPQVIGFRTAITLDRHQTAFGKKNYIDTYQTIDVDNQLMQIDYSIGNLKETYAFWSVGVPVQLSFTWEQFSMALGPKFVFPLAATWHETVNHAALSVYYPDFDNRVYESIPLAASQDFRMEEKGKLTMPKIQYWLASELTYAIPLNTYSRNSHSFLTVGVYVDYCFSGMSIVPNDAESLIMLTDTRDGVPLQRILSPVLSSSRQKETLVSHATLLGVGIKIAYTISPYNPFSRKAHTCHCNK